jgi:hypothetical protein
VRTSDDLFIRISKLECLPVEGVGSLDLDGFAVGDDVGGKLSLGSLLELLLGGSESLTK